MELTEATHDWLQAFNDPFLSYKRLIGIVGEQETPAPIELIAPGTDGKEWRNSESRENR